MALLWSTSAVVYVACSRVLQGSAANIDTVSLDMTNAFADGEAVLMCPCCHMLEAEGACTVQVLEILVTAMTMDGAYVEGA